MKKLPLYIRNLWLEFIDSSLWLSSICLSIFSAGIDGAYLAGFQQWPWMGYALNFCGDMTAEILVYQFGMLQKSNRKGSRKWKLSWFVLFGAVFCTLYSWLFSWRQLIVVMSGQPPWIPFVSAAFVPLILVAVGYTQAIVGSNIDNGEKKSDEQTIIVSKLEEQLSQFMVESREQFAELHADRRRANRWSAYEVLQRDGGVCYYCGLNLSDSERPELHLDHFYPLAHGGTDIADNLVVSCESCNLKKSDRIPADLEIERFKIHLIERSNLNAKDRILLLNEYSSELKQRDIADMVGISASYVSSVLGNGCKLTDHAVKLQERLSRVGIPVATRNKGNGHAKKVTV